MCIYRGCTTITTTVYIWIYRLRELQGADDVIVDDDVACLKETRHEGEGAPFAGEFWRERRENLRQGSYVCV